MTSHRSLVRNVAPALLVSVALLAAACGSAETSAGNGDGATDEPTTAAPEGDASNVARLWIKGETVDCIGEAPQKCLQVADAEDGEYLYFYDSIAGFTFEEGTSYVIDVEITEVADPPADGSSLSYRLIEVIEASS